MTIGKNGSNDIKSLSGALYDEIVDLIEQAGFFHVVSGYDHDHDKLFFILEYPSDLFNTDLTRLEWDEHLGDHHRVQCMHCKLNFIEISEARLDSLFREIETSLTILREAYLGTRFDESRD